MMSWSIARYLPLQEVDLNKKTWARLEDGTPLVTGTPHGKGWLVLFHISGNATWSSLPISGSFVEMLRRTIDLSSPTGRITGPIKQDLRLSPLQLINGTGTLIAPDAQSRPLVIRPGLEPAVGTGNWPGYYGLQEAQVALNLFNKPVRLTPLSTDQLPTIFVTRSYKHTEALKIKPYLLIMAAFLFMLDCLVIFWMAGLLNPLRRMLLLLFIFSVGMFVSTGRPVYAQMIKPIEAFDFSAALTSRIAWVRTGIYTLDQTTEAGLRGLNRYIASRTTLEPGPAVPIDLATDALAFYPLIYWPIHPDSEIPSPETMARVDAFMKQGGSVVFDTRDQANGILTGSITAESIHLQTILAGIDIPALEPVSSDHVLTRTFYLLNTFPGRYSGGEMWVEASQKGKKYSTAPAISSDGVSSIIITSNDLAGAWAVDENFRPLFPTIPPNPTQRKQAFRTGVNLMMYVLTGNYKADQVHLPVLMERLGQ